jgi:hypothetical protein
MEAGSSTKVEIVADENDDPVINENEYQDEHPAGVEPLFGYAVRNSQFDPSYIYFDGHENMRILHAKLQFDRTDKTQTLRSKLQAQFETLREQKHIKKDLDVVTHYLTFLLKHTKAKLEQTQRFCSNDEVEMVFSVPVVWDPRARRDMVKAAAMAIKKAGFKSIDGVASKLFMVCEPEAAATFVLDHGHDMMVCQN